MKNVSRKINTPSASTSRMHGYSIAVMTFDLQLFFARLEIGDLRQHQIQKPARFARLHHGDINPRESVRRFSHRIGQRHAIDDEIMNFFPLRCGRRDGSFFVKNHQRAAQRHSRGEQAGEQTREVLQSACGNLC